MKKTLILYYSYGGNTRKIAEKIQKEIGGDLEEIQTVKPYTGSYNDVVDQGQHEVNSGYMPEIKPIQADLSQYDRIIMGTPVWWYTFAPAVKSFLSKYSLSEKTIYPFATNGGWLGHTFEDFKTTMPETDVKEGLNIVFDGKRRKTPDVDIRKWISALQ